MTGARDDGLIDVTIERLTHGGDGLARHDGCVVFVPQAAPGDRLRVGIVTRRRDWLRGEVHAVLAPGPGRTDARCGFFGRCGGCQWQHLTLAAQRDAKTALVAEQLTRIGGVRAPDVQPIRAADDWRYRARITLLAEGRRLGFQRARSHQLVEIDDCAIAHPTLTAHLGVARAWAAGLRAPPARVTLALAPGGLVLVAALTRRPPARDVDATERLLADTGSVRGAILAGGGDRVVAGDPNLRVLPEPDLALEVPADAFTQVNPAANQLLVSVVLDLAAVRPAACVLDLFCGAGNFALPLARRGAAVIGVERSATAVEAARANAGRLHIPATFVRDAVAPALARLPAGRPDLVVLDPPRAGAAEALPALTARRPARVLYVSCDAVTLARDARTLSSAGYRLGRVQPVDLFPHTHHIETVAEFVLT